MEQYYWYDDLFKLNGKTIKSVVARKRDNKKYVEEIQILCDDNTIVYFLTNTKYQCNAEMNPKCIPVKLMTFKQTKKCLNNT